jgi:hypothetical protein
MCAPEAWHPTNTDSNDLLGVSGLEATMPVPPDDGVSPAPAKVRCDKLPNHLRGKFGFHNLTTDENDADENTAVGCSRKSNSIGCSRDAVGRSRKSISRPRRIGAVAVDQPTPVLSGCSTDGRTMRVRGAIVPARFQQPTRDAPSEDPTDAAETYDPADDVEFGVKATDDAADAPKQPHAAKHGTAGSGVGADEAVPRGHDGDDQLTDAARNQEDAAGQGRCSALAGDIVWTRPSTGHPKPASALIVRKCYNCSERLPPGVAVFGEQSAYCGTCFDENNDFDPDDSDDGLLMCYNCGEHFPWDEAVFCDHEAYCKTCLNCLR